MVFKMNSCLKIIFILLTGSHKMAQAYWAESESYETNFDILNHARESEAESSSEENIYWKDHRKKALDQYHKAMISGSLFSQDALDTEEDEDTILQRYKRANTDPGRPCQTGVYECPLKPKMRGYYLFEDPNDCRYYYECWFNGAYRQDCGVGKHFKKNKCVKGACPNALKNCEMLKQGREEKTGLFTCPPTAKNGFGYPDRNDCQYYFVCWSKIIERRDCGTGKHFELNACRSGPCPYKIPGAKPQEPGPGGILTTKEKLTPVVVLKNQSAQSVIAQSAAAQSVVAQSAVAQSAAAQSAAAQSAVAQSAVVQSAAVSSPSNNTTIATDVISSPTLPTGVVATLVDEGTCLTGEFVCPSVIDSDEGSLFPDPNNCRYFHICGSSDEAETQDCGENKHFSKFSCKPGPCPKVIPNCKPQL